MVAQFRVYIVALAYLSIWLDGRGPVGQDAWDWQEGVKRELGRECTTYIGHFKDDFLLIQQSCDSHTEPVM